MKNRLIKCLEGTVLENVASIPYDGVELQVIRNEIHMSAIFALRPTEPLDS